MNGQAKYILGIILFSIIIILGTIAFVSKPEAPSTARLVEYSDFQCPACKVYQPFVDQVRKKYSDKLVFEYRHFPLPQHPFSQLAAQAAEAAAEQGKFWQMYEYLFQNQQNLSDELIQNSWKEIVLDEAKFQADLKSIKTKEKVLNDLSEGKRLGVNSTPTFFLNNKKLNLLNPEDLEKAVDRITQ